LVVVQVYTIVHGCVLMYVVSNIDFFSLDTKNVWQLNSGI